MPEEYRVTPQAQAQEKEQADLDAAMAVQAAPETEPRPVIPLILSSEKPADKMKEITDRLEQGILGLYESDRYADYLRTMSKFHDMKEITDRLEQGILGIYESDRYADYLRTMSKFHNYSFNNTILIAMQGGSLVKGYKQWEKEFDRHVKPGEKAIKIIAPAPHNYSFNNTILIAMQGGSLVKGYKQWEKEFDRHVKPGEKAIKIIAPAPFTVKKQVEKIDPDTHKPVFDKDGKAVTEEKEIQIPAFRVVSVFDVSQTEGKELPDLGIKELTGDVEQYQNFFAALERTSPFDISFEALG